ncbi:hypothetical protein D3C81_1663640 [compost metagenome]
MGRWLASDKPRSPCRKCQIHWPNRVSGGRSRPNWARNAATVCAVADWPSMAWATSPGSMPTARKMITETANSDNTPSARRCNNNLKILFTARLLM